MQVLRPGGPEAGQDGERFLLWRGTVCIGWCRGSEGGQVGWRVVIAGGHGVIFPTGGLDHMSEEWWGLLLGQRCAVERHILSQDSDKGMDDYCTINLTDIIESTSLKTISQFSIHIQHTHPYTDNLHHPCIVQLG